MKLFCVEIESCILPESGVFRFGVKGRVYEFVMDVVKPLIDKSTIPSPDRQAYTAMISHHAVISLSLWGDYRADRLSLGYFLGPTGFT